MAGEQFSLVWNTFPRNLSSGLYNLLTGEQLVDVTLAAEGQILRAHKLILSVCSTYFRELFKGNSCKHPIVILKDVNYRDLSAMLHFMYQGEVNIKQEDIASFLKVAEVLQIKGLTKNNDEECCEKDTEVSEHSIISEKNDTTPTAMDNDSDVIKEIIEPAEKSCHCPSSNKNSEQTNDKTREDLIQKIELDPEPEDIEQTMEEYLEKESDSQEDQPLDCTLDFIKLPQPERDWRDYKPGIETTSTTGNQVTESIDKQMEHQTDTVTQDLPPDPQPVQYSSYQEPPLNYDNTEASFQSDSASCSNRGRRTVKGIPGSSLSLETTLRVISELGPTIRVERGKVIRMYSCPWCLRHFTRKENLKLHVRYIHGPLESLTCKLCGNKYKNSNSLRVHSYLYHNAKRNKHNKSPLITGGV
ncbi:GDNF-inducible zinc finger protein 1-like [Leptopilina boulardi]|uniref:GDNF-inducible zinc finger protein 1-like n=1 Tax=Leptopilina boulardi TaxID=63433 RepID=UPI0021F539C6|nr:GDNF-inducible zinc finger protein 1-like [Leptopilina boulardi]